MCFGIFRKRKDYIKNSKKYIDKKFNFVSENGYEYDYFFCNGEETFSFCNNVVAFEIYHDIYPFAFDIVLRDGAVSFEETFDGWDKVKRKNVNEILSINWEDIKSTLSPIEIVDYYAELVANNINILEKAFN